LVIPSRSPISPWNLPMVELTYKCASSTVEFFEQYVQMQVFGSLERRWFFDVTIEPRCQTCSDLVGQVLLHRSGSLCQGLIHMFASTDIHFFSDGVFLGAESNHRDDSCNE
jgi:hypothetical protein